MKHGKVTSAWLSKATLPSWAVTNHQYILREGWGWNADEPNPHCAGIHSCSESITAVALWNWRSYFTAPVKYRVVLPPYFSGQPIQLGFSVLCFHG